MSLLRCFGFVQLVVFYLVLQGADLVAAKKKRSGRCNESFKGVSQLPQLQDLEGFPQKITDAAKEYGIFTVEALYELFVRNPAGADAVLKPLNLRLNRIEVIRMLLDGLRSEERQRLVDGVINSYFSAPRKRGVLDPEAVALTPEGRFSPNLIESLREMHILTYQQFWIASKLRREELKKIKGVNESELLDLESLALAKFDAAEKARLELLVEDLSR